MRVAVYNQMFGLNGRNLISFLMGHWRIHFQRLFRGKIIANLDRTIEIIKKSNADIIGICEILEGQERELTDQLNEIGYDYIFYEKGHKTKFRNNYIKIAIASKIKCQKIPIKNFPVKNEMGGGGGIIHCYFASLNTHLINLHLACAKKEVHIKQLDFIEHYIQKLGGKIILSGDFNAQYNDIKTRFKKLDFVSEEIRTCPITFGLNYFCKDLDHIFTLGYQKKRIGEINGYSDHKLIYADLE